MALFRKFRWLVVSLVFALGGTVAIVGPDPLRAAEGADLAVSSSHVGNFVVGETGEYTLAVANVGGAQAEGPIVVTDILPAGMRATGSGKGWECTTAARSVTCSREEGLDPGEEAPPVTVAGVAPPTPLDVRNHAVVASDGGDADMSDNIAADSTRVAAQRTSDQVYVQATGSMRSRFGGNLSEGDLRVVRDVNGAPTQVSGTGRVGDGAISIDLQTIFGAAFGTVTVTKGAMRAAAVVIGGRISSPASGAAAGSTPAFAPNLLSQQLIADIEWVVVDSAASPPPDRDHTYGGGPGPDQAPTALRPNGRLQVGGTTGVAVPVRNRYGTTHAARYLVIELPAGMALAGPASTCTQAATFAVCQGGEAAPIGPGEEYAFDLQLRPGLPGRQQVRVQATTDGDTNPGNDTATFEVDVLAGGADAGFGQASAPFHAEPGSTIAYTLSIQNSGSQEVAPGQTVVTATLPEGVDYESATGPQWSCAGSAGREVQCRYAARISARGASLPLSVRALTVESFSGDVETTFAVAVPDDVDPSNDTATLRTRVGPSPDLAGWELRYSDGAAISAMAQQPIARGNIRVVEDAAGVTEITGCGAGAGTGTAYRQLCLDVHRLGPFPVYAGVLTASWGSQKLDSFVSLRVEQAGPRAASGQASSLRFELVRFAQGRPLDTVLTFTVTDRA